MKYNFDIYGWYTSESNGRETVIEPPSLIETEIPGELRANYTGIPGSEWTVLPYVASAHVPIPEPTSIVPEVITPRQGRIVLSQYGLLSAVDGYFAALTGDGAEIAQIEWEYAQEWRRDWPALVAAATSFGLTTEQIDQMFITAGAL